MTKISILVPVYNEELSIVETINKIKKILKKINFYSEIIIINDGSTDKTSEILEKVSSIKVINNPYNLGYGASLKKGLSVSSGEWIVITDADQTYPIEDIPKLLEFIPQYDMVVGARTGKIVKIPFIRRPAKWFIGKLANFVSGKKIDDINSGLRVFRSGKALEFFNLYPSGFSFTTTITLAFLTNDYTIKYIPINYFKREGKSSIKPIKDFIGFTTLIFRIIMNFKPLKFFFFPGFSLFVFGVIYGIYQIMSLPDGLGDLPPLAILTGIQIILMGFLAELIVKKKS